MFSGVLFCVYFLLAPAQEGILVPFSLTGPPGDPRITAGATLDRVGMHADIMPTLLDLLGLWKYPKVPPPPAARPDGQKSADALFEELKLKQEQRRQQRVREAALPGVGLDVSAARLRGGRGGVDGGEDGGGGGGGPNPGRSIPVVGSGLVGDSLFGPDYRGCAVGATHYGAKTLAVAAGDWKGLFMYNWKKEGEYTHAEVGVVCSRKSWACCLSFAVDPHGCGSASASSRACGFPVAGVLKRLPARPRSVFVRLTHHRTRW